MAVSLKLIALLFVSTGLWIGADACKDLIDGDGEKPCKACPSGWTQFQSTCYMFFHSPMVWADAEKHCTTVGANLISLHSTEQRSFIQNTLMSSFGKLVTIWVGGHDAVKEGVWLWSDGSLFDFKGWTSGEPNNAGNEDCMEMNFREVDGVNDIGCAKKSSFFCAKHL